MVGWIGRVVLGAVWWWGAVRLAVVPGAGVVEGAVVAGGWGLSLLPVHCVPRAGAVGVVAVGRWREAWRGGGSGEGGRGGQGRGG
ncbi:hypothetical protein PV666_15865 [Streptomyces acidiscabies]|uniref:Uncharacterized protein n=1 Tax=Streptomyces acidiscabies TaxID=42234 RepID=A0AAP6EF88_9ACTN|nr:hypothetical protein [Streptomyces acidiscabies]MDX2960005.1 hypothetical protein [Streptomyces acidiscabies]MDX3019356.1 hypothetical protein [Streptomyces acidiscabies]MDX3793245.1 hypothetical protein [Streptomyces acidiscabies]